LKDTSPDRDRGKAGRRTIAAIQNTKARRIAKYRPLWDSKLMLDALHLDKIIGHANALGAVHLLQLILVKPCHIQMGYNAFCRKGGAGHSGVIAKISGMYDIAIMKPGRRYRHHRLIAEFS
jgi:hypothetical protein